jgi:hypothetical protein
MPLNEVILSDQCMTKANETLMQLFRTQHDLQLQTRKVLQQH